MLIEARAKGIDIEESLRQPWGPMLKADINTETSTAGMMQAVHEHWRHRRGGHAHRFLLTFDHSSGYYELAAILAATSVFFAFAYAPWMASFTKTVEARNPALTGTGLAVWGWILRVVVFASFIVLPHVVNTVSPLVNYGTTVKTDAVRYQPEVAFAESHPSLIAFARSHAKLIAFAQTHASVITLASQYRTQLMDAQRLAPELAVSEANPALFTQLATYPNTASIPLPLLSQAIAAAGGGSKGIAILTSISNNTAAIDAVIDVAPQLQSLTPYATQLKELAVHAAELAQLSADSGRLAQLSANAPQLAAVAKAAPALTFLQAHAAAVQRASKRSPGQWRDWYWLCVAACVLFLASVPFRRGRWNPATARQDEEAHEKMVDEGMARLHVG